MKIEAGMLNKVLNFEVPWYVGAIVAVMAFIGLGVLLSCFSNISEKPWIVNIELKETLGVKPVEKPKLVRSAAIQDYYTATFKKEDGTIINKWWFFEVNAETAKQIKDGELSVRLQVGYCEYYGTELLADGKTVVIRPEWAPPLQESRITAGLFSKVKGCYVSSFLIAKGIQKPAPTVSAVTVSPTSVPETQVVGTGELSLSLHDLTEVWK